MAGRGTGIRITTVALTILLAIPTLFFIFDLSEHGGVAEAASITVDRGGGGDYTSIQSAVSAANAGDTIIVKPGTYQESVTINKKVDLTGSGPNQTIIDGGGTGDVVYISADGVKISGFTIVGTGTDFCDAGVSIRWADHCMVMNCTFIGCEVGIFLEYSNFNKVDNNKVFESLSYSIRTEDSCDNLIANNTVNTTVASADGILIWGDCYRNEVLMNDCGPVYNSGIVVMFNSDNIISDNYCHDCDEGIAVSLDSKSNIFKNNTCVDNNHGIRVWQSDYYNIIENNSCSSGGSGISIYRGDYTRIDNNNCSSNYHGIYFEDSNYCTASNNTLKNSNNYGLRIQTSHNNKIYHNNIIDNDQQVFNSGVGNIWNNHMNEGNYWSDYSGIDDGTGGRKAGDWIGDTEIPHLGYDNYPFTLMWGWFKLEKPVIDPLPALDPDGSFNLSWNEEYLADGYTLQMADSGTFKDPIVLQNGPETSHSVSKFDNGTYYFRVRAYNQRFISEWSTSVQTTVDYPPVTPDNITVTVDPRGNALNLSWDLNSVDTASYLIYCNAGESEILVDSIDHPGINYHHEGLEDGKIYTYRIRAEDGIGQRSKFSAPVQGRPFDTVAPSTPENLNVLSFNSSSVSLGWDAVDCADLDGYWLYMSLTPEPEDWGYSIAKLPSTTLSYTDWSVDELTTYYYTVSAVDEVPNESSLSPHVTVSTSMTPYPPEISVSPASISCEEDTVLKKCLDLSTWFIDRNGDEMRFSFTGGEKIDVIIDVDTCEVTLVPETDWSGVETLTFTAEDDTGSVSDSVTVTVTPVNDPPGLPKILSPTEGSAFDDGILIPLRGECLDPDMEYGDTLIFNWTASDGSPIGTGMKPTEIALPIGMHTIKLTVTDSSGLQSSATANVTVRETSKSDSDGDGIPNVWEREQGLDPEDPSDAQADPDGDGATNLEEYLAGTNLWVSDIDDTPEEPDPGDVNETSQDGDDKVDETKEIDDAGAEGTGGMTGLIIVFVVIAVIVTIILMLYMKAGKKPPELEESGPESVISSAVVPGPVAAGSESQFAQDQKLYPQTYGTTPSQTIPVADQAAIPASYSYPGSVSPQFYEPFNPRTP